MRTSHLAMLVWMALLAAGCASRKPTNLPPFEAHAASLGITRGMKLAGFAQLPDGFAPALDIPPMWLEQGREIAVAGSTNGGSFLLGLSGPSLTHGRVLAADFGPGALAGKIADAAANADGSRLATIVAEASAPRLDLVMRGMKEGDYGQVITSFDGSYDQATLAWLGRNLLAIALRPAPQPEPLVMPDDTEAMTLPANGIYLINVTNPLSLIHLDGIDCLVSRLDIAPDARMAVSTGADGIAPALIDLKAHLCRPLSIDTPIKFLGWAPDASVFLFAAPGSGGVLSSFRYVVATGAISTMATGSKLAAIASDGTLMAIGSRNLTWQNATNNPDGSIKVQVALINPASGDIKINELGYTTTPSLLAESSIAWTSAADYAAIDALMPGISGPQRQLVIYNARTQNAYVFGRGPADQPIAMSWSPDGKMLTVVASGPSANVITVFIAPH
jgi:hypothetical protein